MGVRSLLVLCMFGVITTGPAVAGELAPLETAIDSRFKQGQVWRYKTRPGEEASRVTIGKVDHSETVGTIVHVKLSGLEIEDSAAPGGVSHMLPHVPVFEAHVSRSVTKLTDEEPDLEGFSKGYAGWLAAYRSGKAGAVSMTLAEVAAYMELALDR